MKFGFLYSALCAIALSFGACVTDTTDQSEQETGQNVPDNASTPANTDCSNASEVCYCKSNTGCPTGFYCQVADSPPPPFQGICLPIPQCDPNDANCQNSDPGCNAGNADC